MGSHEHGHEHGWDGGREGGRESGRRGGRGRGGPWAMAGGPWAAGGGPPFGPGGWGGPGPWGGGGRRMRRGDIRMLLLAALLDGPAHGYELMGRLETRSGGVWRPSAGSVYPTLQLLEEQGLVTGSEDSGKRVFALTAAGRTEAEAARSREPAAGPEATDAPPSLREVVQQLGLAARQVSIAGDPTQVEAAVTIVKEARQRLYRLLAED